MRIVRVETGKILYTKTSFMTNRINNKIVLKNNKYSHKQYNSVNITLSGFRVPTNHKVSLRNKSVVIVLDRRPPSNMTVGGIVLPTG